MIKEIFNKANYLTFVSLICAVVGMCMGMIGNHNMSMICLILCGICDGFDGPLARKLRKEDDNKEIGVEIDSLADIIAFGVFPIVIFLTMGFKRVIDLVVYSVFLICGLTRLAYYNTTTEVNKGFFVGVPITVSAILFPIVYLITKSECALVISMFVLAILYVSQFKIKKLDFKGKIIAAIIGVAVITGMIIVLM